MLHLNSNTDGYLTNELDIDGSIENAFDINGQLSGIQRLRGSLSIPATLDRTAIHYATTDNWNAERELIGEEGHVYIYSDYRREELEDGTTKVIPGIKIGDGVTYLIDTPFVISGDYEDFTDHIKNWAIHVSTFDRNLWDGKVSAYIDNNDPEELILSNF